MHEQLTPQFEFALVAFLLDAEARQLRPATIRFYRQQIGYFLGFLVDSGFASADDMTAHVVRAYLAGLHARNLAPSSVQPAARAIRAFCNFLVAEEVIAVSPMNRVKLPKADRSKPDAFTPDEVRRLLNEANCARDRAIILCLLDTGCRASEFVAWNVGDVNVMTGTVRVVQTKNRAERTVYLGMKARQALLKHLAMLPCRAPDAPLWADRQTQQRLQPGGPHQLLKRTGRRADVLPCGPHEFRCTFATWSLRSGMDIHDLKTLMGYSGLEILLRSVDTDASAAHKQFGAVDRTPGRLA